MTNTYLRYGIVWMLYLWYAWEDLRKRRVWWPAALLVGIAGLLICPLGSLRTWHQELMQCMSGLFVGMCLWAISRWHGGIGGGDVWAVLAAGVWLGAEETMAVLLLSLLPAALFSLILLVKGRDRQATFPFIPFLLAGLTGWILLSLR